MSKINRLRLLVKAELLKIRKHPLFIISIAVILLVVPLSTYLQIPSPSEQSSFANLNSIQLFSYGFKYGFKVASVFILIFSAMIFSMEFDKGTIKSLLTRPVTRTDVFISKVSAAIINAVFLIALTLYITILVSLFKGELGPIWDRDSYHIQMNYDSILENLLTTMRVALPSVIAAIFFGIVISTLTESSGNAVALALSIFMVLDFISGFGFISSKAKFIFNYYPDYAFNTLMSFTEGYNYKNWGDDTGYSFLVPLGYSIIFASISYTIFKLRNIIA